MKFEIRCDPVNVTMHGMFGTGNNTAGGAGGGLSMNSVTTGDGGGGGGGGSTLLGSPGLMRYHIDDHEVSQTQFEEATRVEQAKREAIAKDSRP